MTEHVLVKKFKTGLLQLVQSGDSILLAVSGGPDSVAMLHLFLKVQSDLNLQLGVVHVHHGIRGEEADRDLEFVRSLAAQFNLPFYFQKLDAKKFAAEAKLSQEEGARILRYREFERFLTESGFSKLATAHTTDDQAETLLDHFLRGAGISGLRGMLKTSSLAEKTAPLSDSSFDDERSRRTQNDAKVIQSERGRTVGSAAHIRPLLDFTRTELEEFVRQQGLQFCVDSTNKDLSYRRNRIRHELIPYLQKHFNPNLVDLLSRTGEVFQETEEVLQAIANDAFKSLVSLQKKNEIILDIVRFLNYFKIIQKYILFQAGESLGIKRNHFTFDKLTRILQLVEKRKIGKRTVINQEFEIAVDYDGIVLRRKIEPAVPVQVNLLAQSSVGFCDYEISWLILEKGERIKFTEDHKVEFVDFDLTGSQVRLRTLQPGDRFIPLNFRGQKKLADFFSDRKIPHHLRSETPILEAADGIVWIGGMAIDDRFKVTTATKRLLRLEIIENTHALGRDSETGRKQT
jgi:tRNA(Ile)-lysidine synthase